MVAERKAGRQRIFQVAIVCLEALRAATAGQFGGHRQTIGRAHRLVAVELVVQRAFAGIRHGGGRDHLGTVRPLGRTVRLAVCRAFAHDLRPLVTVQQRVALQLLLDEGGNFQVGELQQLDGLTQLGRHHQRLRLPEL